MNKILLIIVFFRNATPDVFLLSIINLILRLVCNLRVFVH